MLVSGREGGGSHSQKSIIFTGISRHKNIVVRREGWRMGRKPLVFLGSNEKRLFFLKRGEENSYHVLGDQGGVSYVNFLVLEDGKKDHLPKTGSIGGTGWY